VAGLGINVEDLGDRKALVDLEAVHGLKEMGLTGEVGILAAGGVGRRRVGGRWWKVEVERSKKMEGGGWKSRVEGRR